MKIVISGTGLFTPNEKISNAELVESYNQYVKKYNEIHKSAISSGQVEAKLESSVEFIEKASGIKSRYVINKSGILDNEIMHPIVVERDNNQISLQCEMAKKAASEAMNEANKSSKDIDCIISSCTSPQRVYPAIAIELQEALGIKGYGFDMSMACSSAIFGLQMAVNAIKAQSAKTVLMVNPEICTAQTNFRDRSSHFIFGDACTAMIIEREETATSQCQYEVIDTQLKTFFSNNIRNNAGFLSRCYSGVEMNDDKLFNQEGRKVFKEVTPFVTEFILGHLNKNAIVVSDLKRLWLHQANSNMNRLISRKILGRDAAPQEAPMVLDEYANTSSAGSVIAFHKNKQDLFLGSYGVLSSFGAGYSAGSAILKRL